MDASALEAMDRKVHFHCSFDLVPAQASALIWPGVVRAIRSWISRAIEPQAGLGASWFFAGGALFPEQRGRLNVLTRSFRGDGEPDAPDAWAVRFEHACRESRFRQWRTDIGLVRRSNGAWGIVLETRHWLLPGYVGAEPASPTPTSPGIVGALLRAKDWKAVSGALPLSDSPVALGVGDGERFRDILAAPDRILPVVFLSLDPRTGQPLLDPNRLARAVAGTAVVYLPTSLDVDKELEWVIPMDFRCWDGAIRLYQPGLRFGVSRDSLRHRFFTKSDADRDSPAVVQDWIVLSLTRRSRSYIEDRIRSVEDVDAREREARLAELKADSSKKTAEAYAKLLEEEVDNLTKKFSEQKDRCENSELDCENLRDENHGLEAKVKGLEYRVDALSRDLRDAQVAQRRASDQLAAFNTLRRLPDTLKQAVDLFERLFVGKLVFTPEAKVSATDATLSDISIAWECFWDMATVLSDLYFVENLDPDGVKREFDNRTRFELALTEGHQTKADKRLLELRKLRWEGEELDICAHVKKGKVPPKCLRVHFHPHRARKLIIIGYCSDHLETSGTRRRK